MTDLETLRAAIVGDATLCGRLAALDDTAAFAAAVAREARARGIALDAAAIAAAAPPDPAGARLHVPQPATTRHWPAPGFVPVHLSAFARTPAVTWAYAGTAPRGAVLDQPALRAILERPLDRFVRPCMTLEDFIANAQRALEPAGFVFHMSRAGSTLTANMLGALDDGETVSEIEPVNAAIFLAHAARGMSETLRIALARAIVAAYGRMQRRLFVRFEAWHALALPLLRRAFPHTPFVFLHRDPVEVLASHAAREGRDLVSGMMAQRVWHFAEHASRDPAEMTARALGQICAAARAALGDGGIAVDYAALPDAVFARILPHFAVVPSTRERRAMTAVARGDAKSPVAAAFAPDAARKQRDAGAALRALAEEHVGPASRALQQAAENPA